MKYAKINSASFPTYSHLVGKIVQVAPFHGQYCQMEELFKKNKALIHPDDLTIIADVC